MRGNPDAGEKIILPDVYATYNRDTDTIFVFVCDAVEYLDKLKGYYRSEDYPAKREEKTFAQYLSEHALFGTEVSFLES